MTGAFASQTTGDGAHDGVPYAQPEVVLLFKAKAARQKDQEDFDAVLPFLDASRRHWLAEAIVLAHPAHRWLQALEA